MGKVTWKIWYVYVQWITLNLHILERFRHITLQSIDYSAFIYKQILSWLLVRGIFLIFILAEVNNARMHDTNKQC